MPAVTSLWSYGETGYHSLAAAVVKQRYKREAMASAFRILGEGQLSLTKFLIVLDREVDLADFKAVLDAPARAHAIRDRPVRLLERLDGHARLHRPRRSTKARKGVWLGVGDPVRTLPREFRPAVEPPAEPATRACSAPGCLVVGAPPAADDPGAAARFAEHPAFAEWPLVVVTDDPARASASVIELPLDDVHALRARRPTCTRPRSASSATTSRSPLRSSSTARLKPRVSRGAVRRRGDGALVTRRWKEYFPSGVAMGNAAKGHLD